MIQKYKKLDWFEKLGLWMVASGILIHIGLFIFAPQETIYLWKQNLPKLGYLVVLFVGIILFFKYAVKK